MSFETDQNLVCDTALETVIGEGTFGVVYRAREHQTWQIIAIKIVNYTRESRKADVELEADIQLICNHKNIVKLIKHYIKDNYLIMHMEYFDGVELSLFLTHASFDGKRRQVTTKMIESIRDAVQYIHSLNITHGDLHPKNVMVNCDGEVKIIDFGFASRGDAQRSDDLEKAEYLYRMIENCNM